MGLRAAGVKVPAVRRPAESPTAENASDPVIFALRQAEQAAIRAEREAVRLNRLVTSLTGERESLKQQLRDVAADAQDWQSRHALAEVDRDEALAHAAQLQAEVHRLTRRISELTHPHANRRTT